jgi:hypothetical protein
LPSFAQNNSVDGVIGNTNRWRYQTLNSAQNTASHRAENIAEMVVSPVRSTLNQGFGSSSMTITYITRRGTNSSSGRLYEGYRAEFLDANNWGSSVKPKYHRNDFGASPAAPFQGQAFFFASMAALDVPVAPAGLDRCPTTRSKASSRRQRQANLFEIFAASTRPAAPASRVRVADQSDDGCAHRAVDVR